MSKRYDAGTPLASAITAKDWNEVLDTRDRVFNAANGVRDLLAGAPVLTVLCQVDQATAIDAGEVVELRPTDFTLDAEDLTDQLFQEALLKCKHFPTEDANPLRASFGVAVQPGAQNDFIKVAIAGVVVAKVNGTGAWGFVSKIDPKRLDTGASGFARVVQQLNESYSLLQLGQSQPVFRFVRAAELPYPIQDAAGTEITDTDAFIDAVFIDPHSIVTAMQEEGDGTAIWVRNEKLYVIQGDC